MFSEQMDHDQKTLLVKLYLMGEPYPEPAVAELHQPNVYAGLEFWYATQRAGAHSRPPLQLMQRLAEAPGFEAALSGDELAVNGALPPKVVVEFGLLPIGERSRSELVAWLEQHATEQLGVALMEHDRACGDDDDNQFQRHMDTMLGHIGLLNVLLPKFGVTQPSMLVDSAASTIQAGPWLLRQVAMGWQVEPFPSEEPDLSIPDGVAGDWNEVFDAALEARRTYAASAFLSVVNGAARIGTPAALDFILNYSDDTSPAHEIALRELARALGRESELD